eukprot:1155324-Pelagomonas_calceolata.AAC.3
MSLNAGMYINLYVHPDAAALAFAGISPPLICAAAPHIDGPDAPGLHWCHELSTEVEGLGVLAAHRPTSLVRCFQAAALPSQAARIEESGGGGH